MPKILFVEDDKDLTEMVKEWLTADGYSIEVVYDGADGWEYLRQGHYDIVILDWQLPGLSGPEICRNYRAMNGIAPIIMLTGRSEIAEKEQGFNAGADDYLTKPFNLKELSARIRALLRRPATPIAEVLVNGDLELDLGKHRITRGGAEIHLLPKEFDLLEFFMRRPDEVFSTEALLQRIWSVDTEATSDALRTSIKRLRKKLDISEDESQSIIENIPRVGYRLRKL